MATSLSPERIAPHTSEPAVRRTSVSAEPQAGLALLAGGLAMPRMIAAGVALAFGGGGVLSAFHLGSHGSSTLNPYLHYLRDAAMAVPSTILAVAVATVIAAFLQTRLALKADGLAGRAVWAVLAGVAYGVAVVPGSLVHGGLFEETIDRTTQPSLVQVAIEDGFAVVTPAILIAVVFAVIWGTALAASTGRPVWRRATAE